MSKLIITTVGTSVINNELYPQERDCEEYINNIIDGVSLQKQIRSELINRTAENITRNVDEGNHRKMWSAEISSINAFKMNEKLGLQKDSVIALFSTDTEEGKFCAEVNKKVLYDLNWCNVLEPITLTGIKTKITENEKESADKFKKIGLETLNQEVEKLLKNTDYTENYLNITGGFKAVIPFATIIAFERQMSLIYLYEESDVLIVIPSPPKGQFWYSFEEIKKRTNLFVPSCGGMK